MTIYEQCHSAHLHESLLRYHRAHWLAVIRLSTWSQVEIALICTSRLQISFSFMATTPFAAHVFMSNSIVALGHCSTQTCGVGHPLIGTNGSMHRSKLKKTKYGLCRTSLSTPHLRPWESVGTSSLSMSPFRIAAKVYSELAQMRWWYQC